MLERVHIENYKCLRDVTVDLGPFNVLIGPNDSGKTSFLECIRALAAVVTEPYTQFFSGNKSLDQVVWRKKTDALIRLEANGKTSQQSFHYDLEIPVPPIVPVKSLSTPRELLDIGGQTVLSVKADGSDWVQWTNGRLSASHKIPDSTAIYSWWKQGDQRSDSMSANQKEALASVLTAIADIQNALSSTIEYRLDPRMLCGQSLPQATPVLETSGTNLAGVLDAIASGPERTAIQDLEADLHRAIPHLRGLSTPAIPNNNQGYKALRFTLTGDERPALTIPASEASGGALLLTAFLALAYGDTPGTVLIEEPENGLHPSRLEMVIDILRKMSRGEIGYQKRQIILTTHSPLLLNYVKPEEVRVFTRDTEEGTSVTSMKEVPNIDKLLKEFGVGELWYLMGEEKLFEGSAA